MNGAPAEIVRFLRSVRNRLWLNNTLRLLYQGVYWGAGLLLIGGLAHNLLLALPPKALSLLTLLPMLLALLKGVLFHRPPFTTCAQEADRLYNGHALMTSAWDILQTSPARRAATAPLVVQRALDAVSQWQSGLKKGLPRPVASRLPLALAAAVTASFLLLLPGKTKPVDPSLSNTAAQKATGSPQLALSSPEMPLSMATPTRGERALASTRPRAVTAIGGPGVKSPALPAANDAPAMEEAARPRIPSTAAWGDLQPSEREPAIQALSLNGASETGRDGGGNSRPGSDAADKSDDSAEEGLAKFTRTKIPIVFDPQDSHSVPYRSEAGIPLLPGVSQADSVDRRHGAVIEQRATMEPGTLNPFGPAQRNHITGYFELIRSNDAATP